MPFAQYISKTNKKDWFMCKVNTRWQLAEAERLFGGW